MTPLTVHKTSAGVKGGDIDNRMVVARDGVGREVWGVVFNGYIVDKERGKNYII